jgi:hypothetical protein
VLPECHPTRTFLESANAAGVPTPASLVHPRTSHRRALLAQAVTLSVCLVILGLSVHGLITDVHPDVPTIEQMVRHAHNR